MNDGVKKHRQDESRERWLELAERYFEATITTDEEKALMQFLAGKESDSPEFDEIKAVMGYLQTGKSIAGRTEAQKAQKKSTRTIGRTAQWISIAASIALIVLVGTNLWQAPPQTKPTSGSNETFYAFVDGKEYTDEEFVMQQMLATMNKMSHTDNNVVEKEMEAMFKIGK